MQGVFVLGKHAQKNLLGGVADAGGQCTMTYTNASGGSSTYTTTFSGSCSQQSSSANMTCVNMLEYMNASGDRCRYNCGCDGWAS